MRYLIALFLSLMVPAATYAVELSVPDKKNKNYYVKQAAAANGKSASGYLPLWSAIIFPLDSDNYAILHGVLLGKRGGDSFHYFENADLAFTCRGTGRPTSKGGEVLNECFLNGASTGKTKNAVANYGKASGTFLFNVVYQGDPIGPAAMKWGLSLPKPKAMKRLLKLK